MKVHHDPAPLSGITLFKKECMKRALYRSAAALFAAASLAFGAGGCELSTEPVSKAPATGPSVTDPSGTDPSPTEPSPTEPSPSLAAPGGLEVSPGDSRLTLTWDRVSGATAYEVWQSASDHSASAVKSGDDVSGTSAVITGLTNGATYYLWVKAKNEAATGGFSPRAWGIPYAPSNITVDAPITIEYGTADITVMQNGAPYMEERIVLSKTAQGGAPQTVALEIDAAFENILWYVDETPSGASPRLTLDAADFPVKDYSITVTGWRNNRYLSSKPILFSVND